MTPLDDCCWTCTCGRVSCSDNTVDCGHDDTPTCPDCCQSDHADELLRDALRGWGNNPNGDAV